MAITDLMPWKWNEKKVPVKRESLADPFQAMQHDMDRFFGDFFGGDFGLSSWSGFGESLGAFSPQVDVKETDQEIKVLAELPGLDEKEVEVSLSRDMLTISGEKKQETEDKGENYYRMECSYGSFKRSIPLTTEVEADKVEARFKNGVLTVTLPKTSEAQRQTKRITVKTS
jgi:HSP20 family protein